MTHIKHLPPFGTADAAEGGIFQFLVARPGQSWNTVCTICSTAVAAVEQQGVAIGTERTPLKESSTIVNERARSEMELTSSPSGSGRSSPSSSFCPASTSIESGAGERSAVDGGAEGVPLGERDFAERERRRDGAAAPRITCFVDPPVDFRAVPVRLTLAIAVDEQIESYDERGKSEERGGCGDGEIN